MANDLISRKALVKALIAERDKHPPETIDRYSFGVKIPSRFNQAIRGGIRKALREVEMAPAVDAVEVVRCKDCAYKDIPQCCPCQISGFKVTADWYCPMGVRKK